MAKLPRSVAQAREQAVLRFFRGRPDASVKACQDALTAGALTGTPGPTMMNATVCRLRRQAKAELAALPPGPAPAPTNPAGEVIEVSFRGGEPTFRFPRSMPPTEAAAYVRSMQALQAGG